MNAEEFYERFKSVLVFLNIRWGDMHLVKVHVEDGQIVFSTDDMTILVKVEEKK